MSEAPLPWPNYRSAPAELNLAAEVLDGAMARGCAERAALVGDHGATSYTAVRQMANAVAAGLIEHGLKRGDLVLIKMSNSLEFAAVFLGAVKLGVIPVLVNSLLTAAELQAVLE